MNSYRATEVSVIPGRGQQVTITKSVMGGRAFVGPQEAEQHKPFCVSLEFQSQHEELQLALSKQMAGQESCWARTVGCSPWAKVSSSSPNSSSMLIPIGALPRESFIQQVTCFFTRSYYKPGARVTNSSAQDTHSLWRSSLLLLHNIWSQAWWSASYS